MEQNKQNRSQIWRIRAIAVGAAAGIISAVGATAAFAAVAVATGSFSSVAPWAVRCAFISGGFVSGAVCAGLSKRNPLPNGLCAAFFTVILTGLLAGFGADAQGSLWGVPVCLGAGALGTVPGLGLRRKTH